MLAQIVKLAREQDTFAAIDAIETNGAPIEVAKAYAQLVQDLYYKQKDAPLMLKIGRCGVHFCLREAARVEVDNAELALKLRGAAKMMSFNLSVNCWPAWEDEGIVLTPAETDSGRDLARLHLRLANELKRPPDKVASAHWLLGAHQLAAGKPEDAIASFAKAAALYGEAKQADGQCMAQGYTGIAKLTVPATSDAGRRELDAAIAELRKIDTEDARFYADQLNRVAKFFTK